MHVFMMCRHSFKMLKNYICVCISKSLKQGAGEMLSA